MQVGEEGVTQGLLQAQAPGGVVLHHLLNQVKQLLVVLVLGQHVVLKGRPQWKLEGLYGRRAAMKGLFGRVTGNLPHGAQPG